MPSKMLVTLAIFLVSTLATPTPEADPCATISASGRKWVSPQEARNCLGYFKLTPNIKANTLETIHKMLAFHTPINYQLNPETHQDIRFDLQRIGLTKYRSEVEFNKDLTDSFKRLFAHQNDDAGAFGTYLPVPLVLLDGSVHIAPEALEVTSVEFADQIEVWDKALKGQLKSLSGAKVIAINKQDPFIAVDASAKTTGGYNSLAIRQKEFFSSYSQSASGWSYRFGAFAVKTYPFIERDEVELTVLRFGHSKPETFTIPYRSRVQKSFTDAASFYENNCLPTDTTNGKHLYASKNKSKRNNGPPKAPAVAPIVLHDVQLPPRLRPNLPLLGGYDTFRFYALKDGKTGVLAMGKFTAPSRKDFQINLLAGLQNLKARNIKRLVVDLTNNGGGEICTSNLLHRLLAGPKGTTQPNAGLTTYFRVEELAKKIARNAVLPDVDPKGKIWFNSNFLTNANNIPFSGGASLLEKPIKYEVNGREEFRSPVLGDECQAFGKFLVPLPNEAFFNPEDVVIVTNGMCQSSCATFTITMQKLEGTKIVVVGGSKGSTQQYCGTVGGHKSDFTFIDSTTNLKNDLLAPPDLLTNSGMGVTLKLACGAKAPTEPEEYQDHTPNFVLQNTAAMVNNPEAVWEEVAAKFFS